MDKLVIGCFVIGYSLNSRVSGSGIQHPRSDIRVRFDNDIFKFELSGGLDAFLREITQILKF